MFLLNFKNVMLIYSSFQKVLQQFLHFMNDNRSLTTFQKVFNAGFNLRYKLIGLFQGFSKDNLAKSGDCIYFFGQKIQINSQNLQEQNQLLYNLFLQTPWLTYRAGFPELYHELKGTYVTDTGWGCMIRVGQMAFAQILRQHKKIKSHEQMTQIIKLFSDFQKDEPFSIHKISSIARRQYGIMPGDWYNPSQISHVLSVLNQQYLQKQQKLSFLVFNSGNIFFDQVLQVMMEERKLKQCKCQKIFVCDKCNESTMSIAIVTLTRIGLTEPEQNYLQNLTQIMKLTHFSGMIGGKPGKALYFPGMSNKKSFIYLDPHYVQQAKQDMSQIKGTYFCGSFRMCSINKIDPSIGICFYLQNLKSLNLFYSQIQKLKAENQTSFFIWIDDITPSYISKSVKKYKVKNTQDVYQKF